MSLWCDKYRPERFRDFAFHCSEVERLQKLISQTNFPHLFIYGPAGSGKRTIVRALLYELFGVASNKLKMETKTFEAPSGKKIMQNVLSSNYHLEVNPSENGFYDRVVVQELIKEVATTSSLSKKHHFKVIVIDEADFLTKEAQQALRRTLEKYVSTCRVILIAERSSRIIGALQSRCLMVRNSSPHREQTLGILRNISDAEQFNANDSLLEDIYKHCDQNLRRAILLLQAAAKGQENKKSPSVSIEQFRWQQKIEELCQHLIKSQSLKKVSEIRCVLFDLQTHLIPSDVILRTLVQKLLLFCLDDIMKGNLISMAAQIDHRMCQGSKQIIHLELFCVKFMMMFRSTIEKVAFDLEQPMELE